MSEDSDEDKEHEASQKKLDDARLRGEVVRSADLSVAAGYGGLLLIAGGMGTVAISGLAEPLTILLEQSDEISRLVFDGSPGLTGGLLAKVLTGAAAWFLAPAICVLASILAQRALVFAPEKLMPKLSRISPMSNAGQKFGRSGLAEFFKSLVKLVTVSVLLGGFLWSRLSQILATQWLGGFSAAAELCQLVVDFLFLVFLIAIVIGGFDYLWQRFEFLRRNRMSRQEMINEFKQSEGDPHMKGARRQKALAIANNRMLADVPKADVVIVNPTHYAVALQWKRGSGRAPVCLAKGIDEVAARIREAASTHGVPIHSDPPTARALYASIDIGQEIRQEHFRAVAAAVRFADRMRKKARARAGR